MAGLGDGDKAEHEEEGEEGLDLDRGLWPGVEAGEGGVAVGGGWLAEVGVAAEEVQGVWDTGTLASSGSRCGAQEEGQTVDESGAIEQPASSLPSGPL